MVIEFGALHGALVGPCDPGPCAERHRVNLRQLNSLPHTAVSLDWNLENSTQSDFLPPMLAPYTGDYSGSYWNAQAFFAVQESAQQAKQGQVHPVQGGVCKAETTFDRFRADTQKLSPRVPLLATSE